MFRNYVKIALRNLSRNKGFTFLNITGLVVGMAAAMLIFLWVNREISVDRFHKKGENIYQAYNRDKVDGEIWCWNSMPKPLGPVLLQNYPEIIDMTRFSDGEGLVFSNGINRSTEPYAFVDSTFLKMFSFHLVEGDYKTALDEPLSIVITEKMAKKLFGNEEALNQIVKVENQAELKVTGVLKNLPNNTDFNFNALIPWSLMVKMGYSDNNWNNNSISIYVEVDEKANIEELNTKIVSVKKDHSPSSTTEIFLYPFEDVYLKGEFVNGEVAGGNIELVRLFSIIAILIIVIACINFMNLSTARSERRAKEVGIRKLSGAKKEMLVSQFMMESFMLSFLSGCIALVFVQLLLPQFNNLIQLDLSIPFNNIFFWLVFIGFLSLTAILAGSYPAFFLSSFKPATVLKGTFKKAKSAFSPRKILVVSQFTFAIILIAATIIIKQQIEHVQNRSKGYDESQLVYHHLSEEIDKGFMSFREDALKQGLVKGMTKSMSPITESWSNSWGMDWEGKDQENKRLIYRFAADIRPVEFFGFTLVEGRDIDITQYATDSSAILLNEEAVKIMGFEEPIGQIISDGGNWHVVGVVKDFIIGSPFRKIAPVVIQSSNSWFMAFHMKLNDELNTKENLSGLEALFNQHYPNIPFEYEFIDASYAKSFAYQEQIATLTTIFSGVAIIISCLGLFGLSAFAAEQRSKEIGVRKVLGASVGGILVLLSTDFVKLVLVAILIAVPITWYIMSEWLVNFEYRTTISVSVFAITGITALVIAIFTVIGQALKTALINPVDALKDE